MGVARRATGTDPEPRPQEVCNVKIEKIYQDDSETVYDIRDFQGADIRKGDYISLSDCSMDVIDLNGKNATCKVWSHYTDSDGNHEFMGEKILNVETTDWEHGTITRVIYS